MALMVSASCVPITCVCTEEMLSDECGCSFCCSCIPIRAGPSRCLVSYLPVCDEDEDVVLAARLGHCLHGLTTDKKTSKRKRDSRGRRENLAMHIHYLLYATCTGQEAPEPGAGPHVSLLT